MKRVIKTESGHFIRDRSGVWHYSQESFGDISMAIVDALSSRPKTVPSWFWFNDTPAPIFPNDNFDTLYSRWYKWRTTYQNNAHDFLDLIRNLGTVTFEE